MVDLPLPDVPVNDWAEYQANQFGDWANSQIGALGFQHQAEGAIATLNPQPPDQQQAPDQLEQPQPAPVEQAAAPPAPPPPPPAPAAPAVAPQPYTPPQTAPAAPPAVEQAYQAPAPQPEPQAPSASPETPQNQSWTDGLGGAAATVQQGAQQAATQATDWTTGLANNAGSAVQQAAAPVEQGAQQAASAVTDWTSGLNANPVGMPSFSGQPPPQPEGSTAAPQTPSTVTPLAAGQDPFKTPINGPPSLTRDQTIAAAQQIGLNADEAGYLWDQGVKSGIDPGAALAIAKLEGNTKTANNNIFDIQGGDGSTPVPAGDDPRWGAYQNHQASIDDFYNLINKHYVPNGQDTIGTVMHGPGSTMGTTTSHAYAPIFENAADYPQQVVDTVAGWSKLPQGDQAATSAALDKVNNAVATVGGQANQGATPVEAQRQFEQEAGLSDSDAYTACGPVAAMAFAQTYGRNPSPTEAVQLARQVGWSPGTGMAGVDSEAKLLQQMGVDVHVNYADPKSGLDWTAVQHDSSTGNPVILDTPNHYFYVDGYNPANGNYHVGNSGLVMKGGSEWMTPAQMGGFGGGPVRAAVFANSPNSPTDSVATTVASAPSKATSYAQSATQQIQDQVNQLIGVGQTAAGGVTQSVGSAIGGGAQAVQQGAQQATSAIGSLTSSVGSNIQDQSGSLRSAVEQAAFPAQQAVSAIGSSAGSAFGGAQQAAASGAGAIGSALPDVNAQSYQSAIGQQQAQQPPQASAIDDFKNKIGDAFTSLLGPLLGQGGQAASAIGSALSQPSPVAGVSPQQGLSSLVSAAEAAPGAVQQAAQSPVAQETARLAALTPPGQAASALQQLYTPGSQLNTADVQLSRLLTSNGMPPAQAAQLVRDLYTPGTAANTADIQAGQLLTQSGLGQKAQEFLDPNNNASLENRQRFWDIQQAHLSGQPVSQDDFDYEQQYKSWLASQAAMLAGGELAGPALGLAGRAASPALEALAGTSAGQLATRAAGTGVGQFAAPILGRLARAGAEGAISGAAGGAGGIAPYLVQPELRNDPTFWQNAVGEIGQSALANAKLGVMLGAGGEALGLGASALGRGVRPGQANVVEVPPSYRPGSIESRYEAAAAASRAASTDGLAHGIGMQDVEGNPFTPDGVNNSTSIQTNRAGAPNIDDTRAMSEANMAAKDWYIDGADNGRGLVGEANLPELFTNLGITSMRTSVDENVYQSLNTMLAVRRAARDALANGTSVRDAVMAAIADPSAETGANVTGLTGNAKRAGLAKAYDQGVVTAQQPKTSSYFGNFVSAGRRLFDPRVTNDVWSWRGGANTSDTQIQRIDPSSGKQVNVTPSENAAADSDAAYRVLEAQYQELAREKGLAGHQIQATIWAGTKNLQEKAPDLWELWKNGRVDDQGNVTPAFQEAIREGQARGIFTGLGKGDVRDAFQNPKTLAVLDRARAEGIDLTSPGPLAASRMAREYQLGARSQKLPSTEAFRAGQRIPMEARAPIVQVGSAQDLNKIGYDPESQTIPWISVPHRVDVQGDNAYMHLPGGNSDSARYFGSLFGDASGAPSFDLHYPDGRVENIAGASFKGDPQQVRDFSTALTDRGVEHVTGAEGGSVQIPYAFGNSDIPGTLRSVKEAADAAGIDGASVEPYRGVTDRVDQSSYTANVARGGAELGATGARRSDLQQRALTQLRADVESRFGPTAAGNEPIGTAGIQPGGARAATGLPGRALEAVTNLLAPEAPTAGFARAAESPARPGYDRYYHGTASDFARTDPEHISGERNLVGPGYYLSSSPEITGGRVGAADPRTIDGIERRIAVAERGLARVSDPNQPLMYGETGTREDLARQYQDDLAQQRQRLADAQAGAEVQAPGYAQQRGATSQAALRDRMTSLTTEHQRLGDQIQTLRDRGQTAGAASLQTRLDSVQADLKQAFEDYMHGPSSGPNVRAIDVPQNAPMFDLRYPVGADQLERIASAADRLYPDERIGDELRQYYQLGDPETAESPGGNGRAVYDDLVATLAEHEADPNGPRTSVNNILAEAGYDGITHEGGLNRGMSDAQGNPVYHQVKAIFPHALDKLINATSGTRGGILQGNDARDLARSVLGQGGAGAFAGAVNAWRGGERDPQKLLAAAGEGAAAGAGLGVVRRFAPEAAGTAQRLVGPGARAASWAPPTSKPASKPVGPTDVVRAYHVGNVIAAPATMIHVALSSGFAPAWSLAARGIQDMATLKPSRVAGSMIGAQTSLVSLFDDLGKNLSEGFTRPTNLSQRLSPGNAVGRGLAYVSESSAAGHNMLQGTAQDAITRMELGRMAGERASAAGLSGPAWLSAVRNDIAHPRTADVETATAVAKRAALRGDLGSTGSWIEKAIHGGGPSGSGGLISNMLFPVYKIGMNSLTQMVEASPAGLAGTAFDVARAAAGKGPYAGGHFETPTSSAVTPLGQRLTNNLIGTGMSVWLASKALDGSVTGDGPSNPEDRKMLESQGWQPNSVLVGNRYIDYTRLPAALAGPLRAAGMYADAAAAMKAASKPGSKQTPLEAAGASLVHSGLNLAASETPLRTIGGIYDLMSAPDIETAMKRGGASLVSGAVGGYVPESALARAAAIATDPNARTPEPGDIGQMIEQNIPGLRNNVPVSQDVLGRVIANPQSGAGVLLPRSGKGAPDPLLAAYGNAGVALAPPPSGITWNGRQIPLSSDEKRMYQQLEGKQLQARGQALTSAPGWDKLPPEAQTRQLKAIDATARAYAARQVLATIPPADRVAAPKSNTPTPGYEPTALAEAAGYTPPNYSPGGGMATTNVADEMPDLQSYLAQLQGAA
jgi:hypothetical protein